MKRLLDPLEPVAMQKRGSPLIRALNRHGGMKDGMEGQRRYGLH